jgi:hypothetical protein
MKNVGRSLLILAIGLCAAVRLHAQTLPVTAQLTLQQQDFSTLKNGVYSDKVKTVRLNSTSLLTLLADVYQTEFPSGFPFGSRLVLVNYDHFQVLSANNTILVTNTSPYLTYSDGYANDDYLYQGKENTIDGSQNHSYFYVATIEFNNPSTNGTSFTFSGNLTEKYSKSRADVFGKRMYSDSFALTGYGSGRSESGFFLLSGRITTPTMKWVQ